MTHAAMTPACTLGTRRLAGLRNVALAAVATGALAWGSASHAAAPDAAAPGKPASAPTKSDSLAVNDPFEKMNRRFYANHSVFDRILIRPLTHGYEAVLPKPIRSALHNLVTEISEPMAFANYVVQLRFERAAKTVARFVANATIGVGGLMDPATRMGLEHHDNGFGDTLGRYGIAAGPYLYLPLLGPSNFRDLIGMGVDFAVDPVGWGHYEGDWGVRSGIWIVSGLDARSRAEGDLMAIENNTDPYASMRSFYLQNREAEIHGNAPIRVEDLPQFDDDLAPAPAPTAPPAQAPPPSAAASGAPTSALAPPERARASGDAAAFLAPPRAAAAGRPGGPPIEL
jgi:phospholipid-binding lipoprotein MlaA